MVTETAAKDPCPESAIGSVLVSVGCVVHKNRSYRLVVVACLALATFACDARSPVAPVTQSVTPAAPVVPMGLIHDGEGHPVAGATVSFWFLPDLLLTTNDAGQFPLPVGQYVETIHASKAGYEHSWDFYKSDLKLHAIIRIAAGQSLRVTIRPDDSLGGIGPSRVRRIRVFSNGDRIVHIQVRADDNGPVDYLMFGEECGFRTWCRNPSTFFVEGGGERAVELQMDEKSMTSRTFTVTTQAEDP